MWWGVSGLLELCFDQSTQGGLKMAQHCGGVSTVGLVYGAVEGATDSLSPPEKQEAALERARREAAERRMPSGRLVGMDEAVRTLAFLLSAEAASVNATEVTQDGGLSATKTTI